MEYGWVRRVIFTIKKGVEGGVEGGVEAILEKSISKHSKLSISYLPSYTHL